MSSQLCHVKQVCISQRPINKQASKKYIDSYILIRVYVYVYVCVCVCVRVCVCTYNLYK